VAGEESAGDPECDGDLDISFEKKLPFLDLFNLP
jgi:hypothetical protein